MARKTQNGAPALPNRDHLERAHFALQASIFLQDLGLSTLPSTPGRADLPRLAQNNVRAFRKWTVHNLVKLVKHALCDCNTVLVPGLTARVRVRPSATHGNVVHTTCGCGRRVGVPAAPAGPSSGAGVGAGDGEGSGALDGPVRAVRRARRARRVPFHRRERADVEEEVVEKKGKGKAVPAAQREGHVLWAGGERVSGWGVLCDEPPHEGQQDGSHPELAPAEPSAPTKIDKQQKKQKQRKAKQPQEPAGREQHKALTPEELEELANNG